MSVFQGYSGLKKNPDKLQSYALEHLAVPANPDL